MDNISPRVGRSKERRIKQMSEDNKIVELPVRRQRNWFVDPDITRIEIFDGDAWIEVKKELAYGEKQRLNGAGLTSIKRPEDGSTEMGIDWGKFNLAKLSAWIVDWSLRDKNDKPVKVSPTAFAALDTDVADALLEAIDVHQEALEELKKVVAPN